MNIRQATAVAGVILQILASLDLRGGPAGGGASPEVTFNRDIAPIVFRSCSQCHRPGQSGPFALLTYDDVKKHAKQITEVTTSRFMPPWLPEPGFGEFADDRRLSAGEIEVIRQWVAGGAVEGNAADLPPSPTFPGRWQLGNPDLVVTLPRAYELAAEGRDVYRNFVVPIPTDGRRFVKGVEFRPGNSRVVHHSFINIDPTRFSRRLAGKETPPGFDGMDLPDTAQMPGGQLLGWQPGKLASFSPPGLAWVLEKNTDLVLQLHLHPTGKKEEVLPEVGFFFTDQPPTNMAYRLRLESFMIDIPPGATNHAVEQNYTLPIDVTLLRILPHAHYLGKELGIFATLPDGRKEWLILIRHWDFNWQGDYAYKTPVRLPKGTRLTMDFIYDNSTNNVHNPDNPPRRVKFGLQSTDEMAAGSLQVLPDSLDERKILAGDYYLHAARVSRDYNLSLLAHDPRNADAHAKVARALMSLGDLTGAQKHLGDAIRAKPDHDKAYYDLGAIWFSQNRTKEAERAFQAAAHYNPDDYQAYGQLGIICMRQGRLAEAETHLRTAVRLNPEDEVARQNLEQVLRLRTGR
jgi:mono/diheme cytochrome c family protein